ALLILDCGSGVRQLSVALEQRWNAPGYTGPRAAHILLTHPHLDHVLAGRFLEPLFDPRNAFTLWAPRTVLETLHAALDPGAAFNGVFYPITLNMMQGLREVREVRPSARFSI